MLIFCCIRSPSLCTLALHIAGSLWRLDFNHSVPFQVPSSLSPLRPPAGSDPSPSLVHPIYMHNCLWSIYLSPLVSHPPACAHSRTREREREKGGGTSGGKSRCTIRITFFPSGYFCPLLRSANAYKSECLVIRTCSLRFFTPPPGPPSLSTLLCRYVRARARVASLKGSFLPARTAGKFRARGRLNDQSAVDRRTQRRERDLRIA